MPALIRTWYAAVGSYAEEYAYADLLESYLHQRTLLDVAYAVVPHVASQLDRVDPDRRSELLEDLAVVESVRLLTPAEIAAELAAAEARFSGALRETMLPTIRERLAPLPADLAPAYLAAIAEVARVAGDDWRTHAAAPVDGLAPRRWRRHVRFLRGAGWTDPQIAGGIDLLRSATAGAIVELVYLPWPEARAAVAARLPKAGGELAFRALHTLAWNTRLSVETMLRVVS